MNDTPHQKYRDVKPSALYESNRFKRALVSQLSNSLQVRQKYQQCEFTQDEREKGLQSIIRQMISVYGYEATRNAFFNTLCDRT